MNEATDTPQQRVDRKSLDKLVEASVSRELLDKEGVIKIIELLDASSIGEKRELLNGAIESVDVLLSSPNLTHESKAQFKQYAYD